MSAELNKHRRILRIPVSMIVLSVLIWIGGLTLQISSPTAPDSRHTIPIINRGTTHYLSPPVYYFPWIGLGIGVVGILTYWILCRRIARQLGISVDTVMGISRTLIVRFGLNLDSRTRVRLEILPKAFRLDRFLFEVAGFVVDLNVDTIPTVFRGRVVVDSARIAAQ